MRQKKAGTIIWAVVALIILALVVFAAVRSHKRDEGNHEDEHEGHGHSRLVTPSGSA